MALEPDEDGDVVVRHCRQLGTDGTGRDTWTIWIGSEIQGELDRQIISVTDLPPFGSKRFEIPFDAAGKAWVRFAVWDSAGNGAFVQPVWVDQSTATSTGAAQQP